MWLLTASLYRSLVFLFTSFSLRRRLQFSAKFTNALKGIGEGSKNNSFYNFKISFISWITPHRSIFDIARLIIIIIIILQQHHHHLVYQDSFLRFCFQYITHCIYFLHSTMLVMHLVEYHASETQQQKLVYNETEIAVFFL